MAKTTAEYRKKLKTSKLAATSPGKKIKAKSNKIISRSKPKY